MDTSTKFIASLKDTTRKLRDIRAQIENTPQVTKKRIGSSIQVKFNGGIGGIGVPLNRSKLIEELLFSVMECCGCERVQLMEFHGEQEDPAIPEVPFEKYSCTHEAKVESDEVMSCWKHYQKCPIALDEPAIKKISTNQKDLYIPEVSDDKPCKFFSQETLQKLVFEGTKSTYFYGLRIREFDIIYTLGFIKIDFVRSTKDLHKIGRKNLEILELVEKCTTELSKIRIR